MKETYRAEKGGIELTLDAVRAGKDLCLTLYGGDTPHIGAVVLSEPRPSLTGSGTSVTSSVLNRLGHKDEELARLLAEETAKETGAVTVCAAGVHIEHIAAADIEAVRELTGALLERLLQDMSDEGK